MNRARAAATRAGFVAVLSAVVVTGFAGPATAQDNPPLPDLTATFGDLTTAEINSTGTTIGVTILNLGRAEASQVQLRLDVSGLNEVDVSVPGDASRCSLAGSVVTCEYGSLQAGEVNHVYPLTLASRPGAAAGDAGSLQVAVALPVQDADPGNNTASLPVVIAGSGADLAAYAEDVSTEDDPVGPGDVAPLYTAVFNDGDIEAPGFSVRLHLPLGAAFGERYEDCEYASHYPEQQPDGYAYGPTEVTCVVPLPVAPGTGYLLFDPETGESVFTARFGRNLAGPMQTSGTFEVAESGTAGAAAAKKAAAPAAGGATGGKSFAAAVAKLRSKAVARGAARLRAMAQEDPDTGNNLAEFGIFTKPNELDVLVETSAVTGEVGDTVQVAYKVVNNGPSDGGGPGVLITAPTGTVLLPADWCWTDGTEGETRSESAKLRCNFESEFPAVASGRGTIAATFRLKIKAEPGTDGTIVVRNSGPSTESKPANNTAAIVINAPDTGGGGGGLPITGTPVGLIAIVGAGTVALGAVFLLLTRRRRS